MPVQPTYPGVYIQEVPSGVRTMTGVSTSIAAFFGRTQKGPINKAVRCLSYSDFLRSFGGAHPLSDLGPSVNQFFANGGTDCYVVRLAKNPAAATVTLSNITNDRNVLVATAKGQGTWGQDIKLSVDYNTTNPDDSFNLTVTHESNGSVLKTEVFNNLSMNPLSPRFAQPFVTQSSKLIDLSIDPLDMGSPLTPAAPANPMNAIATTPAAYSESRRVFSAGSDAALLNQVKNEFQSLIAAGKYLLKISMNGKEADVDLRGLVTRADWTTLQPPAPPPNDITKLLAPIQAHINSQLAPSLINIVASWRMLAGRTAVLRLSSNSSPFSNVTISRGNTNDISADLMFGVEAGGIEVGRYSNLRPAPNGLYFSDGNMFAVAATEIDTFSVLNQNQITIITVGGAAIPANLITTVAAGTDPMYNRAGVEPMASAKSLALLQAR